jgi:hypothetical protein
MRLPRLAVTALFFAAVSCSDSTAPHRELMRLGAARERWRAQDLHTYAYELRHICFCANTDRLYVAVVDDTVQGVLDLDTGEFVDINLGRTVEDLFTFIENAAVSSAHLIRAEYDPTQGFPTEIDYDGDARIADDEISYLASNVHPITPQH